MPQRVKPRCCKETPRAWLVCLAAFIAHFLCLGLSYVLGIYLNIFVEVFEQSQGLTSWISSLNFGMLCFSGPLVSVIINKFGFRSAMFAGGMLSSAGFIIAAFAPNIWVLIFGIGAVSGLGFGLVHTTAIVAVGLHFTYYRSIALGLSISGAGLGTILHPLINVTLIDYYGWRSALLFMAALISHACLCAMLLHPVEKSALVKSHHTSNEPSSPKPLLIYKVPGYCLTFLSTMFFNIGIITFFTHIAAFAVSIGHTEARAASLISLAGIGGTVGRLLSSTLSQYACHPALVITLGYTLCGSCILVLTRLTSFPAMLSLAFFCGIGMSPVGPVLADITMYVVGIDHFGMAFGWIVVAMGSGVLGGPAAGLVYDLSTFYPASFYLGAAAVYLGTILIFPVWFTDRIARDLRQEAQNTGCSAMLDLDICEEVK